MASNHLDATEAVNKRLDQLDTFMKLAHHEHTAGPHMYVNMLAVAPDAQGHGHAGMLMRAVSAIADEEHVPCYLECSGSRNASVYRRFGYEVRSHTQCAQDASPHTQVRPYLTRTMAQVVGTYEMAVDGDVDGSTPLKECFAMVRPAATP